MEPRVNQRRFPIDPFGTFIAAANHAVPEYRRLVRGTAPRLEINGPERFVRRFIAEHFDKTGAALEGQASAIVEPALAAPAINGLALVAAALVAHRDGRWTEAVRLSERAFALDQHETFAQRIYLAAREQSESLRLEIDDWLADRFCANPFTDAEIIGSRDVYTCCAAWLPAPLGSAETPEPSDWWRGQRAAEIRRSILDGDFGYCSRLSCPRITARALPRREDVADPGLPRAIDSCGTDIPAGPDRLLLSYDTSCNLSCPSCRTSRLSATQAESAALDAFYDRRVAPLVAGAGRVKVTGSGDPLGSRHFRQVLQKITALPGVGARLQLHTNGVLLDERAWTELSLEGHVRSVWISMDATVPGTYAVLRREGDFDRLVANLLVLGARRRAGQLGELRLDFVVQADNVRQMPDFVRLARAVGADGVHFLMLRNWGTFDPQEYQRLAVVLEGHPEHGTLLDVLSDPVLGSPDVDLGNLAPLREAALAQGRQATSGEDLPVFLALGCARTGSNYLFQALRSFSSLCVLSEVFNPRGVFGLEHYRDHTLLRLASPDGVPYQGEQDPRLIERMRRDPLGALRDLRRLAAEAGYKALVVKVFSDHLSRECVARDLIAAPHVHPLILTRDLLSSYISLSKARATSRWMHNDTTELKIAVDPSDCMDWLATTAGWYAEMGTAIRDAGKVPLVLDYARTTANPAEDLFGTLQSQLRHFGLELPRPDRSRITLERQDLTPDPFGRILNGDDLREDLTAAGWLDTALAPSPLGRLAAFLI